MKINACSGTTSRWKIIQPRPSVAPLSIPAIPALASTQINRNTISPPNILPNSRIASDTGLLIHSTILRMRLNGSIHLPNGAVRNSLLKPPKPLLRRAKNSIRKNTLKDRPSVALTSAVATGFQ